MVPKCTGAEVSWAEVSRHRYDSTQYSLAPQFTYCIDDVMLKCAASTGVGITGVGIAGVGIAVCSRAWQPRSFGISDHFRFCPSLTDGFLQP